MKSFKYRVLIIAVVTVGGITAGRGIYSQWIYVPPQLQIEPREVNLGEIPLGAEKRQTFQLRNIGDRPLRLLGASGRCDCVQTKLPAGWVNAGATTRLDVSVKGTKLLRHGLQHVDIRTDNPGVGDERVSLVYSVVPETLTAIPSILDFGRVAVEELPKSLSVEIHRASDLQFVAEFQEPVPYLSVVGELAGLSVELDVTAPVGGFYSEVSVKAGAATYQLPVMGYIRGSVVATPAELLVKQSDLPLAQHPTIVTFQNRSGTQATPVRAQTGNALCEFFEVRCIDTHVAIWAKDELEGNIISRERHRSFVLAEVADGDRVLHVNIPFEFERR